MEKLLLSTLASIRDAISNLVSIETDFNKQASLVDIENALDFAVEALETKVEEKYYHD